MCEHELVSWSEGARRYQCHDCDKTFMDMEYQPDVYDVRQAELGFRVQWSPLWGTPSAWLLSMA